MVPDDTMIDCTAFYRTYGGENSVPRPSWYSKTLCLKSFLQAVQQLRSYVNTHLVVLYDGPLHDSEPWAITLKDSLASTDTILEGPKTNNAVSSIEAIKRACELEPDHAVIIAEDDYLWLPDSLCKMVAALLALPADYVTGYDHPLRYLRDPPWLADVPHWDTRIYFAGDHHWRTQESTCMTFVSTPRVLREDFAIFQQHHNTGRNIPDDQALFRHLQGLAGYQVASRRRLVGPLPSLNTHAHLPWLAPRLNWDTVARATMYR